MLNGDELNRKWRVRQLEISMLSETELEKLAHSVLTAAERIEAKSSLSPRYNLICAIVNKEIKRRI